MKRALSFLAVVILITAASGLWQPSSDRVIVMYRQYELVTQGSNPPPAPSSISRIDGNLRLSLEYVAKHKQYAIQTPLSPGKSYTEVSLLLESLINQPLSSDVEVDAKLIDDLGQIYRTTDLPRFEPIDDQHPVGSMGRYLLRFPPINPQATNLMITFKLGDQAFELSGAALP